MKTLMFALLAYSLSAFATVDGHDRVYLVVQHVQSEEYMVQSAPFIGCYGLPQGARLGAWTAEYKVPVNIGCGGTPDTENINALTCAKVTAFEESKDYWSFSKITLDISACPGKDDPKFITMVRTSAAKNFPQKNKKKQVQLTLIK